jgi:hypothetical protein
MTGNHADYHPNSKIVAMHQPVLALTDDVRLICVEVVVIWTVQPTSVSIIIDMDGETITHIIASPVSGTYYLAVIIAHNPPNTQGLVAESYTYIARAFTYESQSMSIGARVTGGTVSNLSCRAKWAKLVPT